MGIINRSGTDICIFCAVAEYCSTAQAEESKKAEEAKKAKSGLTTALPLQNDNISIPAEQLHNVPAEALGSIPWGQALDEPEPELGIPSAQVAGLPHEPPRRITVAPPAAVSVPTAGPSKRDSRTTKNQPALADPLIVALSSKVDQVTRISALTKTNRHGFIPRFKCFFCGWSGSKPDSRTDQANNHRTGVTLKPCKVFQKLGGAGNLSNIASFLLARWPELLGQEFADDQLYGKLQTALNKKWDKTLSQRALDALETFRKTKKSPPAGNGYWDPELVEVEATTNDAEEVDELMGDVETDAAQVEDAMMEDVEWDELMEDDGE
ncbi:hypothetical protein BKA62DRAFT_713606 [Auriculariales sp. MPI-PUGE-AT-0066]|nr:hypothetical protein BKA62DRAFT_713606 [Auriculariales sp. MPI-PUGE-AT-0066]